jgi:hypothetical protein
MNVDADSTQIAFALLEGLADLRFVLIVFLLEVHVPMIVPACAAQLALSKLIQFARLFSIFERLSEFLLVVRKGTS